MKRSTRMLVAAGAAMTAGLILVSWGVVRLRQQDEDPAVSSTTQTVSPPVPVGAGSGENSTPGGLQELVGQDSVTTEVNAKAPGFASSTFDGEAVRSIDFQGNKVLLLEFWSVFCTSCILEMPFLAELQRKYGPEGLQVVGVNTDYFGPERVKRFLDRLEFKPPYPIIHDRSQQISRQFNVEALPVTVLIDSSGWIRMYHLGYKPADQKTLESLVKKWVGKIRETTETVRSTGGKTPLAGEGNEGPATGAVLPAVTFLDEQGRRMTLNEYRAGRPLVLFYWSLFCQPCREEMPQMAELSRRLGEKGVAFLSVNVDTSRLTGGVKKFLSGNPLPFPTALDAQSDPPGGLEKGLGVAYTPTIVMAGMEGTVRKTLVGGSPPEVIEATLGEFAASR
jgi:peroxiredoxin